MKNLAKKASIRSSLTSNIPFYIIKKVRILRENLTGALEEEKPRDRNIALADFQAEFNGMVAEITQHLEKYQGKGFSPQTQLTVEQKALYENFAQNLDETLQIFHLNGFEIEDSVLLSAQLMSYKQFLASSAVPLGNSAQISTLRSSYQKALTLREIANIIDELYQFYSYNNHFMPIDTLQTTLEEHIQNLEPVLQNTEIQLTQLSREHSTVSRQNPVALIKLSAALAFLMNDLQKKHNVSIKNIESIVTLIDKLSDFFKDSVEYQTLRENINALKKGLNQTHAFTVSSSFATAVQAMTQQWSGRREGQTTTEHIFDALDSMKSSFKF